RSCERTISFDRHRSGRVCCAEPDGCCIGNAGSGNDEARGEISSCGAVASEVDIADFQSAAIDAQCAAKIRVSAEASESGRAAVDHYLTGYRRHPPAGRERNASPLDV